MSDESRQSLPPAKEFPTGKLGTPRGAQRAAPKSQETLPPHAGDTSLPPESLVGAARDPSHGAPPPTVFGRYKIVRLLGAGAMGAVYLAEDTQLGRQVALKMPHLGTHKDATRLERFYREARIAATLHHPHICPVYDVGECQGTHFISTAFVQGKPLTHWIRPQKLLSERVAASLVRKVALALHEAHTHGVIHRDLKPANIMIDQRGEPIVMDFGLARQANCVDQPQITQAGAILGTPSYMAPEQVQGDGSSAGASADIYALGVILYQLLTSRLPFEGSVVSVLAQIATQTAPPPSTHRPGLSSELEKICQTAMARQAGDRFGSMVEFANALGRFLRASAAGTSAAGRDPSTPDATAHSVLLPEGSVVVAATSSEVPGEEMASLAGGQFMPEATAPGRVTRRRQFGLAAMVALLLVAGLVLLPRMFANRPDGSTDSEPVVPEGEYQLPSDAATVAGVVEEEPASVNIEMPDWDAVDPSEVAVMAADEGLEPAEPEESDQSAEVEEAGIFSEEMEGTESTLAEIREPDEEVSEDATEPATGTEEPTATTQVARKSRRPPKPLPFAVNSFWKGNVTQWIKGDKKPASGEFTIQVTERTPSKFKAIFASTDGKIRYEAIGRCSGKTLTWSTVDARVLTGTVGRQSFLARLVTDNRLEFQFSGTTKDFRPTRGAGMANLQE
ncbi:MAG: serine/threonine protein kinase [Planctomycetales bacterium]